MRPNVYVGLGSNLDDRRSMLREARLALRDDFTIASRSSRLETEPFEIATDRPFLNQVVEIDPSNIGPERLLQRLLSIERSLGRNREGNSPDRRIDMDLLYYNQTIKHSDQLDVPHPEAHRRVFVLKSMVELSPTFLHPERERTQTQLLVNALGKKHEN